MFNPASLRSAAVATAFARRIRVGSVLVSLLVLGGSVFWIALDLSLSRLASPRRGLLVHRPDLLCARSGPGDPLTRAAGRSLFHGASLCTDLPGLSESNSSSTAMVSTYISGCSASAHCRGVLPVRSATPGSAPASRRTRTASGCENLGFDGAAAKLRAVRPLRFPTSSLAPRFRRACNIST